MLTHLPTNCIMEYDVTGTGPAVLLLHAFPLSNKMFAPQVAALQATHRVILPNHRGFGATQGFAGPPSIDQMADDAAALLDMLKIAEPVVVGGVSMGGYVALAFARRHSNRLMALILADTKADPDAPDARANRDKTIAFMRGHSTSELIDQMMPKMVSHETLKHRPDVVERVRTLAAEQSPNAVIGALQAMRDRPDATSALGKIDVPVLILVGTEDAITPPSVAVAMAGRIKRATVAPISGAGHLANLEKPEEFSAAVKTFLASL